MSGGLIVAIAGIIIEIIVLAIIGVWAVGTIKTTTAVLTESIKALKNTIDGLKEIIERMRSELTDHQSRISVLESK